MNVQPWQLSLSFCRQQGLPAGASEHIKKNMTTTRHPEPLSVRIGDLHVVDALAARHRLQTLVGSCVGLLICAKSRECPQRNLAGLAHILLPRCPDNATAAQQSESPAKYAAWAVDGLIHRLRRRMHDQPVNWTAHLVGGANMFADDEKRDSKKSAPSAVAAMGNETWMWDPAVGGQNVREVRRRLAELEIPIVTQDCGGSHGRNMIYDARSEALLIRHIHRPHTYSSNHGGRHDTT